MAAKQITLQYLDNRDDPAVYIASVGGGEVVPHEGNYAMRTVSVADARAEAGRHTLDREGFRLISRPSRVRDFFADDEIAATYEPEVAALVREVTGADTVRIFDHTRRSASEAVRKQRRIREPASIVHNDYTDNSGPRRLRDYLREHPDQAGELEGRPFAIVNVWRSIGGTVENYPLVMCDARSVPAADLVAVTRQARDRVGEIQLATHSPAHRWLYFPRMTMDEALVFKTFDSATDGRCRFTLHASFDDPDAPADAPPRQSIETRCFVFF